MSTRVTWINLIKQTCTVANANEDHGYIMSHLAMDFVAISVKKWTTK